MEGVTEVPPRWEAKIPSCLRSSVLGPADLLGGNGIGEGLVFVVVDAVTDRNVDFEGRNLVEQGLGVVEALLELAGGEARGRCAGACRR